MHARVASLGLLLLCTVGCGGSGTPSAAPENTSTPPPVAAPEPAPAPQPAAPKRVKVESIQVEGGGVTEADVEKALEPVSPEWEKCYASALEKAPDAGGRTLITLLYVKSKIASVSASYSGPGSEVVNGCFQKASEGLKLSPPANVERSVVSLELKLEK